MRHGTAHRMRSGSFSYAITDERKVTSAMYSTPRKRMRTRGSGIVQCAENLTENSLPLISVVLAMMQQHLDESFFDERVVVFVSSGYNDDTSAAGVRT